MYFCSIQSLTGNLCCKRFGKPLNIVEKHYFLIISHLQQVEFNNRHIQNVCYINDYTWYSYYFLSSTGLLSGNLYNIIQYI